MTDILVVVALVLLVVVLALTVAALRALRRLGSGTVAQRLDGFERLLERNERAIRDDLRDHRGEAATAAQQQRSELAASARGFSEAVQGAVARLGEAQQTQLEAFARSLGHLSQATEARLDGARQEVDGRLASLQETLATRLDTFRGELEARLGQLAGTVDARLVQIQQDNERRLEQMRVTVEEKLQGTLEQRLGESFRTVSAQLAQVHEGLGEMQKLAAGVGDLKKVLTNVKARGTWGEVQLAALLEQVLTPDQYARNVATRAGSRERVEFAIRLPGRDEDGSGTVWLPIDAKFPMEDYQRLTDAAERSDPAAVEAAARALEQRVLAEARSIRDKYLDPPRTTDFAILFLATEGLYAEVLRRPGMVEQLQRELHVVVTGPTTLAAVLSSLQMGFRTLAIERRTSEVWKVLGAVKTEFGKFGETIDKVSRKLHEASDSIEQAARRRRAVERRLKEVEALPADEAGRVLPAGEPEHGDGDTTGGGPSED